MKCSGHMIRFLYPEGIQKILQFMLHWKKTKMNPDVFRNLKMQTQWCLDMFQNKTVSNRVMSHCWPRNVVNKLSFSLQQSLTHSVVSRKDNIIPRCVPERINDLIDDLEVDSRVFQKCWKNEVFHSEKVCDSEVSQIVFHRCLRHKSSVKSA